jgi:mRNA interferase RelE/StbE
VIAARHRLEFSPAAARQLRKFDRAAADRIRSATEQLRDQPRPPGATALQGRRGYLRIRVGDYRVIYSVDDDRLIVLVAALGHRREVYNDR